MKQSIGNTKLCKFGDENGMWKIHSKFNYLNILNDEVL